MSQPTQTYIYDAVEIPVNLLESKLLSDKAKLLYLFLRGFEDMSTGFPTFEALTQKTGFGHSTLSRALKELRTMGLISVTRRSPYMPYRCNLYTFNTPDKWKLSAT